MGPSPGQQWWDGRGPSRPCSRSDPGVAVIVFCSETHPECSWGPEVQAPRPETVSLALRPGSSGPLLLLHPFCQARLLIGGELSQSRGGRGLGSPEDMPRSSRRELCIQHPGPTGGMRWPLNSSFLHAPASSTQQSSHLLSHPLLHLHACMRLTDSHLNMLLPLPSPPSPHFLCRIYSKSLG